jgi:proline iminopeptidase
VGSPPLRPLSLLLCCSFTVPERVDIAVLNLVPEQVRWRFRMLPADGYVTTSDGLRLWFQTVGSGPQVVVLPNGFHLLEDFSCLAPGRTLLFYDVRNRGRSDSVTDPAKLVRGIHNDVDDLEAVRLHFGLDRLALIGHSYMGLMVILFAMKYPTHVDRIVQIGAMGPYPGKTYPPDQTNTDSVLADTLGQLAALQKDRASYDPVEFCRKCWSILRPLYVSDPKDAGKIRWDRCDLPNERGFMRYWTESLLPSITALSLTPDPWTRVRFPVLTIHGAKDRSVPFGGAQDWAQFLSGSRLLSIEDAGHGPWIEAPSLVFGAIAKFLGGAWAKTELRWPAS